MFLKVSDSEGFYSDGYFDSFYVTDNFSVDDEFDKE